MTVMKTLLAVEVTAWGLRLPQNLPSTSPEREVQTGHGMSRVSFPITGYTGYQDRYRG